MADYQTPEPHRPIIRRPAFWVAVVVVSALFIYVVRQPSNENKRQAAQLKAQMMRDQLDEQTDSAQKTP